MIVHMKNIFLIVCIFLLSAFDFQDKKKIRIFLAGDSTISIKEVKAYPETGWGMPFVHFWDSTVTVVNRAKNGRSTKTFISEGLWNSIITEAGEGDYIFIQFGHNDEAKEKLERYTTPAEYRANLIKFIEESRARKATPVLLTPVSRRRFDKEGKIMQTHEEYSGLVREIAKEKKVTIIDLDEKNRALYQSFGPENSKQLFLQLQPGEHPNYPEGRNDNTHFNEYGARLIAQLVLAEIRNLEPELAGRIVKPVIKKP